MELILSHWHCILPIIVIIAAVFFMRGKPQDKASNHDKHREDDNEAVKKNDRRNKS